MPKSRKSKTALKSSSKKKKIAARARKTVVKSQAEKVRIRTYRHGLGDCHLLSFKKSDGSPFNILIDCGVVNRTQNPIPLMTGVADNVKEETKGVLDVVVATHQHTDHLSGFKQADPIFRPMEMRRLWLAWTEDPNNPLGSRIKRQLVRTLAAVREAALKLTAIGADTANRIQSVLQFFGPAAAGDNTQAILNDLQGRSGLEIAYYKPGDTFLLPEVPNVRVYVLGPPEDPVALKITNPRASKKEGYEAAELASSATGLAAALLGPDTEQDPELSYPFERIRRKDASGMKLDAYFKTHYYDSDPETGESQDWRQIETAWLESAEELALALNSFTNNTSLALAFEFVDSGEVLLFPGDAQIGSWLTWKELGWIVPDSKGQTRKVDIADLFSRTVFYKGSHHASHNGTLSGLAEGETGLEQMTHRDLVCVVPVDRAMSKIMKWDRTLPWAPLLKRLSEKTRGRLLLTDVTEKPPDPQALTTLSAAEREHFSKQVVVEQKWIEYTLW
ncbi:MAG: hypothetical protein QOG67_172 [Verrucomicrobiota bacterium]|jgi:hypothetical protein